MAVLMNVLALEIKFVELSILGVPGIVKKASTCWMHNKYANSGKARTIIGVMIPRFLKLSA